MRAFEVCIARYCHGDHDRIDFLLQCLAGEVRDFIDDEWGGQISYADAVTRFEHKYGNMDSVVVQYDRKLKIWDVINDEESAGL